MKMYLIHKELYERKINAIFVLYEDSDKACRLVAKQFFQSLNFKVSEDKESENRFFTNNIRHIQKCQLYICFAYHYHCLSNLYKYISLQLLICLQKSRFAASFCVENCEKIRLQLKNYKGF